MQRRDREKCKPMADSWSCQVPHNVRNMVGGVMAANAWSDDSHMFGRPGARWGKADVADPPSRIHLECSHRLGSTLYTLVSRHG